MHKVIVERPRWNPGPAKYGRRQNRTDDQLPKLEGMKRPYVSRKSQKDLLGPLHRWLQSQVGRGWNDVYSEACAVVDPRNYVRVHVKTHLLQYVERNAFVHEGKVCVIDPNRRGRGYLPLTELQYGFTRFFVHPETGLLCAIPPKSLKVARAMRRVARQENVRWLDGDVALKQIKGIWFACQFRRIPHTGAFQAYDYAMDQVVGRGGLTYRDSEYLHCINRRQLSRRELRRYDLRNEPVSSAARAQPSACLVGILNTGLGYLMGRRQRVIWYWFESNRPDHVGVWLKGRALPCRTLPANLFP